MAIWKYFIRNVLKCYSSCEEHNSRPILSLVSRALLSLATSVQLHREIVAQQSSFSRSCTPLNQQSVPPPVQQCNSPRAGGRDIFPIALISRKLSQFWRGRSGLVWLFCSSNIHLEDYTVTHDHCRNNAMNISTIRDALKGGYRKKSYSWIYKSVGIVRGAFRKCFRVYLGFCVNRKAFKPVYIVQARVTFYHTSHWANDCLKRFEFHPPF